MTETLDITKVQIPALSERLTPLQRTIAESYQRVFMRGNRTDDLLIFSGLINEIANAPAPVWNVGVDLGESDVDRQIKALQDSETDLTKKLRLIQSDLALAENVIEPFRKELFAAERVDRDLAHLISRLMFVWNKHKEDGYTLKSSVTEQREAKEQAEGKYQTLIAVMGKHFGNDPAFHLADDMAQFLDSSVQSLIEELEQAQEGVKRVSLNAEKYDQIHDDFRPKLEPIFGQQALSQSIEDCFRNLIARYNGACARITQLESLMAPAVNEVKAEGTPLSPCALIEVQEEPEQEAAAEVKRGPGRPKKPVLVEHTDLSDLAKKFYLRGVPTLGDLKKHLPNVAQLAYGDGLTVTAIAKSLQIGLSDASDILRVVDSCLEVKRETEATQSAFMAALEEVSK
jgi:hypothetical protein